jgi:hypothetical protein
VPAEGRRSARERGLTVDDYVAKQPAAQAKTIRRLRAIVKAAAPKAAESIKWGQPVYEQDGPFAFIKAASKHVTFGFRRGTEIPDRTVLLGGSGGVMRHMKISDASQIPAEQIRSMVRAAVRLNREKGDPTRRR